MTSIGCWLRDLVSNGYQKRGGITELYNSEEVCELYKIARSTLFDIGKRENIPKTYNRGRTYWSKKHIDAYFAQYAADPDITEWCTADEITERFGMILLAVYNLAYDHNIPKKKEGNKTFYSKRHVQEAKGVIEKKEIKYYTVPKIMEKYSLTRDQVYHYLKQYKVSRIKKGQIVLIPQKEFDQIFEPPTISIFLSNFRSNFVSIVFFAIIINRTYNTQIYAFFGIICLIEHFYIRNSLLTKLLVEHS